MIAALERDRSAHATCKLQTALQLAAQQRVRVPALGYRLQPSRLARAVQMGNSLLSLLSSGGENRTIVSGQSLAYVSGELEYFSDHISSRALHLVRRKQPFFVISSDALSATVSAIDCDPTPAPRIRLSTQCLVIVIANHKGVPAVWRIGGCDEGRGEILRHHRGIEICASDAALQMLGPRLISHGVGAYGLEMSIETRLPGAPSEFSWERVDAVWELWRSAGRAGTNAARGNLAVELTRTCDTFPRYRDSLCPLRDALLDWHSSVRMPGEVAHGDLWLGNVLFTGSEITGIVDWEWAQADGLRVLDLLHLLFMSYAVSRDVNVAECFRRFWKNQIQDAALESRLDKLQNQFALDREQLKFVALLLWFDYLHQRVVRGRMPSRAWTEDMIPRTIPVLMKWLGGPEGGVREAIA